MSNAATPQGHPGEPDSFQQLRDLIAGGQARQNVDNLDFLDTRLTAVKRAIAIGMRPVVSQQAAFNRAVIAALASVAQMLDAGSEVAVGRRLDRLDAAADELASTMAKLESALERMADETTIHRTTQRHRYDEHEEVIADLARRVGGAELDQIQSEIELERATSAAIGHDLAVARVRLRDMETGVGDLRNQVQLHRARLDLVLRALHSPDEKIGPLANDLVELRSSELYEAFENRFRGTQEDILGRLEAYGTEVEAMAALAGPVVDLGSGRGEWLAFLARKGIPAYGVDTNARFVKSAADAGLKVIEGDAIRHMVDVAPGSLGGVTAFHLVEHLPSPVLLQLLDSALVACEPGGWLILETPNPLNLNVGAASFYLDPTHLRPLHPELLRFLVEYAGFGDVEVRYLNPVATTEYDVPDLHPDLQAALKHLFHSSYGPQDFAVIARKPGGDAPSRYPRHDEDGAAPGGPGSAS